jgi:hypothetical protein
MRGHEWRQRALTCLGEGQAGPLHCCVCRRAQHGRRIKRNSPQDSAYCMAAICCVASCRRRNEFTSLRETVA